MTGERDMKRIEEEKRFSHGGVKFNLGDSKEVKRDDKVWIENMT